MEMTVTKPSAAQIPLCGTTEDAMEMLRDTDPERYVEVQGYAPIAWLSQLVTTFRAKCKMSQTALADALDTTQPTISRLESGEVDPSFSRACEVLAALGYRLVPVPISDESIFVGTITELQETVHSAVESMLPDMQRMAVSAALVRIADAGLQSVPRMNVVNPQTRNQI